MTKTVLSIAVAMCVALSAASAFAQGGEPKKHKKMVSHHHHMVTHHHHMKPKPMEPKPAGEEQK